MKISTTSPPFSFQRSVIFLWISHWLKHCGFCLAWEVTQLSLCVTWFSFWSHFLLLSPRCADTRLVAASSASQGCAVFPGGPESGRERGGKTPRRLLSAPESSPGSSDALQLLPRHLRNTFETSPACWALWLGWRGNPHSLWSLDTWTVLEL